MNTRAHAEKLFEELGPILEPLAIVYDADETHWAVVNDETSQIDVAYDEDSGCFIFALDLGTVPEEAAETVHELLLRFSFVWRQTGGVHASLDGDGHAVLMYKHAAQGLDVQTLQALLGGLYTHSQYWADLIADSGDVGISSEVQENAAPFGSIRP